MKTKPKYQSRMSPRRQRLKGEPIEVIEIRDGTRLGVYGFDKENGERYFTALGWVSTREVKRKLAFDIEADNSEVLLLPFADPVLTAPKIKAEERLSANAVTTTTSHSDGAQELIGLFQGEEWGASPQSTPDRGAATYAKPYISYVVTTPEGADSVITDLSGHILAPAELTSHREVREYLKAQVTRYGTDKVRFDYKIEA